MYPVGWPCWKLLAKAGISLVVKIEVVYDKEAGVYVATSPNLRGLVAEAKSKEELVGAVYDCVDLLMECELPAPLKHKPLAAWDGEALLA